MRLCLGHHIGFCSKSCLDKLAYSDRDMLFTSTETRCIHCYNLWWCPHHFPTRCSKLCFITNFAKLNIISSLILSSKPRSVIYTFPNFFCTVDTLVHLLRFVFLSTFLYSNFSQTQQDMWCCFIVFKSDMFVDIKSITFFFVQTSIHY